MEIKDITFAYADGKLRLKEVQTSIPKGKITTIIGPNGSGKSTFMNILTRSNDPKTGHVLLNGRELKKYSAKELAKTLAVVYQENMAPDEITVKDLVSYGRLPYQTFLSPHSDLDEEKIMWALQCTGLVEKKDDPLHTLSGGEQQRCWIALSLAQDTRYLLLDEPTANLDIFYQYDILELIQSLSKEHGLTILMVLHDLNQAIQYSDYLLVMREGKIVKQGPPDKVITEQLLKEVYGIRALIRKEQPFGTYILPLGT